MISADPVMNVVRRSLLIALGLAVLIVLVLWATGARIPEPVSKQVGLAETYSVGHEVPEPPPSQADCASPYAWRIDSPVIDTVADIRRSAEQSILIPMEGYAETVYFAPDGRGVRMPWYADESGGSAEQFRWHQLANNLQISERQILYAQSVRCIDKSTR